MMGTQSDPCTQNSYKGLILPSTMVGPLDVHPRGTIRDTARSPDTVLRGSKTAGSYVLAIPITKGNDATRLTSRHNSAGLGRGGRSGCSVAIVNYETSPNCNTPECFPFGGKAPGGVPWFLFTRFGSRTQVVYLLKCA